MSKFVVHESSSIAPFDETWCGEKLDALPPHEKWTSKYRSDTTCGNCLMVKREWQRAQEVIKHAKAHGTPATVESLGAALTDVFAPTMVKAFNRESALLRILPRAIDPDTSTTDKGK